MTVMLQRRCNGGCWDLESRPLNPLVSLTPWPFDVVVKRGIIVTATITYPKFSSKVTGTHFRPLSKPYAANVKRRGFTPCARDMLCRTHRFLMWGARLVSNTRLKMGVWPVGLGLGKGHFYSLLVGVHNAGLAHVLQTLLASSSSS